MPLTQAQRAQVVADKTQAQAAGTAGDAAGGDAIASKIAQIDRSLANVDPKYQANQAYITRLTAERANLVAQQNSKTSTPLLPTGAGAGRGSQGTANSEDGGQTGTTPETTQIGGVPQNIKPTPNVLSDFSTYTYNINLHVLTAADYKVMINNPQDFTPTRNIISGGNKYNKTYTTTGTGTQRSEEFVDDFYFDGLQIKTVIGPSSPLRSSNVVDIKFTIVEPYGLTFVNRLIDIQRDELDGANYLDTPYLLEINFFGTDDVGNQIEIVDQQKFICIKIATMKIKVTSKGAEYQIQAVPFHYQANFASSQALKSNFNVTADTVGSYFANDSNADQGELNDAVREQTNTAGDVNATNNQTAQQVVSGPTNTGGAGGGRGLINATTAPPPGSAVYKPPVTVNTTSLPGAYNHWNLREAIDGHIDVADTIRFNIDPEISEAKIVDPNKNTVRNTPAVDPKTASKGNTTSKTGPQAVGPDLTKSVHNLNAGTQILAVIDMVMLNSDYILNQLNDSSIKNKPADNRVNSAQQLSDLKNGAPVNWYRTIPQVELTRFDSVRNVWGKIITYNIQKYTYYNDKHDAASKSPPPPAVKEYQYIYTGQNTEVIDFNIEFNALHFVPVQVNNANTTALNIAKLDESGNTKGKKETNQRDVNPVQKQLYSGDQSTTVGGSETRVEAQNAEAFAKNIYTAAGADLLNIKLSILGDPQFIKQDDIHYNPSYLKFNYNDQFVPPGTTNSIAMDNGEIFCNLIFKTPVDIDDNTGLLRTDGRYSRAYYSGYYKILTVDSEFKGGKFTQSLDCVRYANQSGSGEASTGPDSQTTDANRTGDNTVNDKSQNPSVSGKDIQKPVNFVGPPQTNNPLYLKDGDANVPTKPATTNWNDLIDPYEQVPAEWPGTPPLSDIAKKGPTVPIGTGANAQGEPVVLATTPSQ